MATIISFANQKGGVGKTAGTHMIAKTMALKPISKKILVIEGDHQKNISMTVAKLKRVRPDFKPVYDIITTNIKNVVSSIKKNNDTYEIIFVDLPGILEKEGIRTALLVCDIVFIPIKSGDYDIDSSVEFLVKIAEIAKIRNKKGYPFAYYAYVSFAKYRSKDDRELIRKMESAKVSVLENRLKEYQAYKTSCKNFLPIVDYTTKKSTWSTAEFEFDKFFTEVKEKIENFINQN